MLTYFQLAGRRLPLPELPYLNAGETDRAAALAGESEHVSSTGTRLALQVVPPISNHSLSVHSDRVVRPPG